ncbi:hypothetical protein C3381_25275 [Citrobacter freundii complex sp. CFNIH6]|nr:hypothetical protein C3368_25140 [Citrobacter freundii complex sp. CFNIH7]POU08855.1 hypothetical protein C3381_25275 [Citrobacter freundii complex sp. CFNIH6]
MPPGSLNGPVKLTIARTSELSHRRTLLLSHYNISAHNVYYVKYGGFALKFMSPSLSGTYR